MLTAKQVEKRLIYEPLITAYHNCAYNCVIFGQVLKLSRNPYDFCCYLFKARLAKILVVEEGAEMGYLNRT